MLIIMMSIAGTIPLLFCIAGWLILPNSFSPKWGLQMLKISMFFYLTPLQLIQQFLPRPVYKRILFIESRKIPSGGPIRLYYNNECTINIGEYYIWIPRWLIALLVFWCISTFVFSIYEILKYNLTIKKLIATSTPSDGCGYAKYPILVNNLVDAPFSIGFFKSYIIFPDKNYSLQHKQMMLRHEVCHIKNRDSFLKLICMVIGCIHWFNPCAWLLLVAFDLLCEYDCDNYATTDLNQEQRKVYARLLVNSICKKNKLPIIWRNNFSFSKSVIQRRVNYIMKNQKKSTFSKKLVASSATIITVFFSAVTIFAYKPLQSTNWNPETELTDGSFYEIVPEEGETDVTLSIPDNIDFSRSNIMLQTEEGKLIPFSEKSASDYALCRHTFAQGTLNQHFPESPGGCKVNQYKITYCKICNYIKNKTFYNSISFLKCPHN
ncbi:MAG: M56 family metallopeptidase [Eubacteriales bacterium]|nr:M56 family metallopeptidase [Eubacteriales bacterium]